MSQRTTTRFFGGCAAAALLLTTGAVADSASGMKEASAWNDSNDAEKSDVTKALNLLAEKVAFASAWNDDELDEEDLTRKLQDGQVGNGGFGANGGNGAMGGGTGGNGGTDGPNGAVGGDPHFAMWDGAHHSYHGGCDLVMVHSPTFASGLGLDLHIRTEVREGYSFVKNAALRIGDDVLEVVNDGSFFVNSKQRKAPPAKLGSFRVNPIDGTRCNKNRCRNYTGVSVSLGGNANIEISVWRKMIFLNLAGDETHFNNSAGIMGTWGKEGLFARDGRTKHQSFDEFAESWQVLSNEPKLFSNVEGPQHPEMCRPPLQAKSRRRLGGSHGRRLAESACAHVNGVRREFCLFDVMMTGDTEMASAPFYNQV